MTTPAFQRARSAEQRAARRLAILDVAAAMLAETTVAQLSLNELSRRVGLAKSNVLRYFESREAVLLELLDAAWQEWLAALAPALDAEVDAAAPVETRREQVATVLVETVAVRPLLCELVSSSAAVLEHNVSPIVALRYKRAAVANGVALARLARRCVPELGEVGAGRFAADTVLALGAVWAHSRPSPAMLSVYQTYPELAGMRLDFGASLHEVLATLLAGLLARPPRS